jgi:hypothetical protein
MAELAEGARLLSECGAKVPPRVRIPLSPPQTMIEVNLRFLGLTFFHASPNSRLPPVKIIETGSIGVTGNRQTCIWL